MKAITIHECGPPSVLKIEDMADPKCHPKGIIIANKAISIEGGDLRARALGPIGNVPHIIGYQSAGIVTEVGSEVSNFSVGDHVVAMSGNGSHAELRSVSTKAAWHIPKNLSFEEAASIPVTFATAHDCLFEFGHLDKNQIVLVNGISGGLGIAIAQFAHQHNANIIGTVSDENKVSKLKEIGINNVIVHTKNNVIDEINRITDDKGVDLAIDPVGGHSLEQAIHATKYRGSVISVGNASRSDNKVDIGLLMRKNISFRGMLLASEQSKNFTRVYSLVDKILKDVANKKFKVYLDKVFPFNAASDAHQYAESRKAFGRVIIEI
ncbi:MAG: NADP-dependent oxidoreductase [Dehalococcoidaceae bacterium]|nr:NADP-dependent oxidoreductase [Dehalococcoidaceae bacterium]